MSFHSTSIDRRLTPSHISFISYKQAVEDSQWNEVTVKDSHPQPTGNYIVAAHNIKRNTTVITENPFIRQLNVEHQKTHCQYCFKKIQRKVVCRNSECNWSLLYCSSPCENSYWLTGHKWLCRFPELSSLHRDVLLAFQGYIQCRTLYSGIPDLVSNINMHNDLQIQEYKDRIGILTHAFHLSSSDIDTLINIQAQIRCNSFAVKQSQLNNATSNVLVSHEYVNRGRAVYLKASLINHSCSPNAIALFGDHDNPTTVSIKTIDPILLNEEVCISYGPLATQHARKERKEKLQNNYFFDCSCSACQQSKKDTFETVYKCQYCETGQLYKEQERCASCQKKADWNYYSKVFIVFIIGLRRYLFPSVDRSTIR
ncbi:hypothetical protein BDB01DRAFT_728387 [Pilobolus umbonatus]|nr:hypothetical protein BDB01DRAFT_728387 [Pilobolus umbonatus]